MRGRPGAFDFHFRNSRKHCRATDESVRLDDGQSLAPGKESGKQYQGQPGIRLGSTRLDLTLKIQSHLLAEEKILGGQSAARLKAKSDEPKGIEQLDQIWSAAG